MSPRPPVALFAFNRPQHLERTLAGLRACRGAAETPLLIFLDGPRGMHDQAACDAVAAIAESADGFLSVSVSRSPANQGLFEAITRGVGATLAQFDTVVVVEDDIVVSEDFLDYMADNLARFHREPSVACIHGYALPIPGLPDFFFLRGGDCWGWATWRNRWSLFRPDAAGLLGEMRSRGRLGEFMETHGAVSLRMLCRRALGRNQSWAILWHASLFLANRFTLHPGRSFVANIGNDGSGTHGATTERYRAQVRPMPDLTPETLPVRQDAAAARAVSSFMDGLEGGVVASATRGVKRFAAILYARWVLWKLARHPAPRTTG